VSTALPVRQRRWTPKAIPFGVLVVLLGLWAFFAPLVGGYFGFGFYSGATWEFSVREWELHIAPGIVAALGGAMLLIPARGWGWAGGLLAFLGGAWLVVGWAFYPVWASGTIEPYGDDFMRGLRWLGHLLGPGGLVLFFTGCALGLFMRPPPVEQALLVEEPPEPVETTQVLAPE
jgi:hypothetical protein